MNDECSGTTTAAEASSAEKMMLTMTTMTERLHKTKDYKETPSLFRELSAPSIPHASTLKQIIISHFARLNKTPDLRQTLPLCLGSLLHLGLSLFRIQVCIIASRELLQLNQEIAKI